MGDITNMAPTGSMSVTGGRWHGRHSFPQDTGHNTLELTTVILLVNVATFLLALSMEPGLAVKDRFAQLQTLRSTPVLKTELFYLFTTHY